MTKQEIIDAIALLITDPTNKQNTADKVRQSLSLIINQLNLSAVLENGTGTGNQAFTAGDYSLQVTDTGVLIQGPNGMSIVSDADGIVLTPPTDKPITLAGYNIYKRLAVTLTQDDVRTLFSANGGYGYKIFEALGANKLPRIANVMLKFNRTAGTYPKTLFEMYGASTSADLYTMNNTNESGTPPSAKVWFFETTENTPTNKPPNLMPNDEIYLFSLVDFPDYEGTATLILDYHVEDFS